MLDSQPGTTAPPKDASRAALNFVHNQLTAGADTHQGLESFLQELSVAFTATGAAIATLQAGQPVLTARVGKAPSGTPMPLPWGLDRTLLARPRPGQPGMIVTGDSGESMLVAAWSDGASRAGLLWLERIAHGNWSAGEAAALGMAGQVLARQLGHDDQVRPRWADQADRIDRQ